LSWITVLLISLQIGRIFCLDFGIMYCDIFNLQPHC